MCGIAGAIVRNNIHDAELLVNNIVDDQFNRGPDFQKVETVISKSFNAVFGHNRLSIIDLAPEANQPMWDSSHNFCVVFNGEIYNYLEIREELTNLGCKFRTQSDTEVIIQAFSKWGENAVTKFNGMFAFAIYDKIREEIWLFRDRFGVKPLFIYQNRNGVYFASTAKIIAQNFNLEPNLEYISRGLSYWIYEDDSNICQYNDMMILPAAHYARIRVVNDKIDVLIRKYYDFKERILEKKEEVCSKNIHQIKHLIYQTLNNSVDIRLRADVPIGISLSGGLDSSVLSSLFSEKSDEVIGFTYGHPNEKQSEGPLVDELTKWNRIKVDYIWPTYSEIEEAFIHGIESQDSPFSSFSILAQYMIYKRAKERGIKVIIGGQGGDESLMGYRKFFMFKVLKLIRSKNFNEAFIFIMNMFPMLISEFSNIRNGFGKFVNRYLKHGGIQSSWKVPQIADVSLSNISSEPLWGRQMLDFTRFSLPTLLRYEDRNSMANSIESRLPFLDYRLAELCLALPDEYKLRNGFGKWILREIVKGKIPESIRIAKYKMGFSVPQNQWIDQGLGKLIRNKLHENSTKLGNYFDDLTNIDELFSNNNLKKSNSLISDSISLIWLSSKLN